MGDIRDKVAVVGIGCTKFGELFERSAEDLIVEAGHEAMRDAGIGPDRIEAAWVGTLSSAMSGNALSDPLKLTGIPITRVENYCASGMEAVRNGAFAVAAGMYDVVLALGFEKMKDMMMGGLPAPHPVIDNGEAPHVFAMAANRYFADHGADKSTLAKIAMKNHANGAKNPKAHLRMEVSEDKVLGAPMVYAPLGLFDCCPTTDGAAAVVLCKAEMAGEFSQDPVYIKGLGLSVSYGRPQFDPGFAYDGFPSTQKASGQAYEQAGITAADIDLAEVHDCFTITEILNYEDLGFCERGQGGRAAEEFRFALDGDKPVNPSGGLKSFGHPIGATGVRMVYEVTQQLRGQAGERQVKDARLGLAHNLGGQAAVAAVTVLGNERS
ncbi:MAG: acetyl-CoA acetyltransferase [Deltaproteobacteria bacterium]